MVATGVCGAAVDLLNTVFASGLILNDGHEIYARLEAGEDPLDIIEDMNAKFGRPRLAQAIRAVGESWPPLHREAASQLVRWAMSKLDTDDRITVKYKGDAEAPETVTRFELRDHSLVIEFAHPRGQF
jgi:hypothetical protein